jgi:small-conductance mechanosensitive channel
LLCSQQSGLDLIIKIWLFILKLFFMDSLWNKIIMGNSVLNWVIAIGIIVISFAAIRIGRSIFIKRIKAWAAKTSNSLDDFFVMLAEKTLFPVLYIGAVYFGVGYLTLNTKTASVLHVAVLLVSTFFVIRAITSALNYFINSAITASDGAGENKKQARGIIIIVNIVIWVLGIVFLVNNLGYDITSVITGLGIGGIAIALAAQTILGDLFNYFVIFFDKPFEIGDFIIVDDKMGVVEYIGVKSTRLRTLSGEQLICSNTNLTNSRVHNYKRMEKRRVVFSIGVTYDTDTNKIENIPAILRDIIDSQKSSTQFDRAHFSGFGDFSLNFEAVYYILSADYNLYMDVQQEIYLSILKTFKKEGIEFAYPTQTLLFSNNHNNNHNIYQPANKVV